MNHEASNPEGGGGRRGGPGFGVVAIGCALLLGLVGYAIWLGVRPSLREEDKASSPAAVESTAWTTVPLAPEPVATGAAGSDTAEASPRNFAPEGAGSATTASPREGHYENEKGVVSAGAGSGGGARRMRAMTPTPRKNVLDPANELMLYWDGIPEPQRAAKPVQPDDFRNIRKADYAGAETCKDCHEDKHADWLTHSHRLMNAEATDETVVADFSGKKSLEYLGGVARFETIEGRRQVTTERDGVRRSYEVKRTIGSRFFQYYVGLLKEGPEPANHPARRIEEVLPLGWWIETEEIVPIVHVDFEKPDSERYDPFEGPTKFSYDRQCSSCHVTVAAGDWMMQVGSSSRLHLLTPRKVSFHAAKYLYEEHPDLVRTNEPMSSVSTQGVVGILRNRVNETLTRDHAVSLGISCETCHLGCAQHVKDEKKLPPFFLSDPAVFPEGSDAQEIWGRNSRNQNWFCSRCHAGGRPQYANGMDTWNSTEFSDAIEGFCYDAGKAEAHGMKQLTCIHCHDPHKGTGKKWPQTPREDDAKCTECHQQFQRAEAVVKHTHHPMNSHGSRCMNCHMPKVNEGMQDMVRTHVISNPTDPRMIEANQPNACNLCHLDKPIDWTVQHLAEWYGNGGEINSAKLAANYSRRDGPTGAGYLESSNEAVRLAGSEALFKQNARWALSGLLDMLDDPYLINRQFTQKNFRREFGVDPRDYGYRFTMTATERQEPIQKMRKALLPAERAETPK